MEFRKPPPSAGNRPLLRFTRSHSVLAGHLVLAAMVFGASVGLGTAFFGAHDAHDRHRGATLPDYDNCVFCLDGVKPCPVEARSSTSSPHIRGPELILAVVGSAQFRLVSLAHAGALPSLFSPQTQT